MIPSKNLSEAEIRYAMAHTKSCYAAAKFLRVDITTFKKYSSRYKDTATGLTLYEMQKNQGGVGMLKSKLRNTATPGSVGAPVPLQNIFDNKNPNYDRRKLKKRLIKEGIKENMCEVCGYNESRITDNNVPIVLEFMDGDLKNYALGNLRFICFNCYHNQVGNLFKYSGNKPWVY